MHNDCVPEDLYAFGNSKKPRPARAQKDFKVNESTAYVGGNVEKFPKGASLTNDVELAPLNGHYHKLSGGKTLPEGLGIIRDGVDVFPDSPHARGHYTIYPTREMTVDEFNDLFENKIEWTYGGKK